MQLVTEMETPPPLPIYKLYRLVWSINTQLEQVQHLRVYSWIMREEPLNNKKTMRDYVVWDVFPCCPTYYEATLPNK